MTSEQDKSKQDQNESSVVYQDLIERLSPDEAFFEMANSPIISFRITDSSPSSSTVSTSGSNLIHIEQKQELENSCGGIVWESAFALAEYLRKQNVFKKNKKHKIRDCIDIGAGTGFLGIWVHKQKRIPNIPNIVERTVITDTMECFELMKRNVKRNFSESDESSKTIDVQPLDWTSEKDLDALATTGRGKFDLLVATDVIFAERLVEPLIRCLKTLIDPDRGVCYVCAQPRDKVAFELFQEVCAKEFSQFRRVPEEELAFSFDAECKLFEMRL
jgi:predicted nicotinamide N-methyase